MATPQWYKISDSEAIIIKSKRAMRQAFTVNDTKRSFYVKILPDELRWFQKVVSDLGCDAHEQVDAPRFVTAHCGQHTTDPHHHVIRCKSCRRLRDNTKLMAPEPETAFADVAETTTRPNPEAVDQFNTAHLLDTLRAQQEQALHVYEQLDTIIKSVEQLESAVKQVAALKAEEQRLRLLLSDMFSGNLQEHSTETPE